MMKVPKRFSLRLLIAFVSVSALAFACEATREGHRRDLVEAIRECEGGIAVTDTSWMAPFPTRRITSVTIPYMSMDRFSDRQLSLLVNLREIYIPDVQCPCPGEVQKRKTSCLVPRVVEIPISVPPDAKKLLNKIRGRQDGLSRSEVKLFCCEERPAKTEKR